MFVLYLARRMRLVKSVFYYQGSHINQLNTDIGRATVGIIGKYEYHILYCMLGCIAVMFHEVIDLTFVAGCTVRPGLKGPPT